MATWNNTGAESEGVHVLEWLFQEALNLNPDGTVGVLALGEPQKAASLLSSRLRFNKEIPQRQQYVIARQAIIDAVKAGQATPAGFLEVVTAKETGYLSEPLQSFVMLTSLSASDLHQMPTVRLGGATITLSRYPPPRFKSSDAVRRHQWQEKRFSQRTAVRVHVRERTAQDAFDLAMRQLDLLRAFWNLGLHRGTLRISFGGSRPLNDIRLGPIHTMHHSDGTAALEWFWYESDFKESEMVRALGAEKRKRVKAEEAWCRARIRRFPQSTVIEDLFVRYCRALDQADQTNAFLQMWSILEDLTGNPSRYSDLVQRASYLYTDRWYVRLQLEEMRQLRNDLVHSGRGSDRFEELVDQLKGFVEHYLSFLLNHRRNLRTLDELAMFLAQPTDLEALRKRRTSLELAEDIFTHV